MLDPWIIFSLLVNVSTHLGCSFAALIQSVLLPCATYAGLFSIETALVGIPSLNITILYNGANAFQAGFVFLAAVLAVMIELNVCLTLHRSA
eukprot:Transcript_19521.p2 GENE.Transcript_19521~~Transcript_19521.p2  ORF type:complete len:92 (+),score=7.70 Transcript_19521:137-412(+)